VRSYAERKGVADYTKSGEITFRVAAGPVSGVDPVLKAAFIDGNPERESVSADETVKVGDVSFKMVGVEGGSFRMGATEEQVENADADEKPVKDVTLEGFEIGETEVTAALWNAVMRSLPYGNDAAEGDKPVVNVSYYDAEEFILKLNELTGRKFRLPTEAEWEYAARGGSKSSGYKFAGASECYKVGQFVQNASSKVQPVKGLKPNELGIYDMSGNVWEWTCGLYDNYADGTVSDPDSRVLRGGSCSSKWDACRVSNRQEMKAVNVKGTFGFRLAL
jgi:formylglycine-generating enzyme required for sulfatase activity